MGSRRALARRMLEEARRTLVSNVEGVSLEEALEAAGGYRSVLGILKHVAGWNAVYCSYAFDAEPRHWKETDWPRGLRDRVDPSAAYLDEIMAWFEAVSDRWIRELDDADLDVARPLHWGGAAPLDEIITLVASHWLYHAGEINAILALRRGEAWEHLEEVEENHISTLGHRVRPPWMTDDEWKRFIRTVPKRRVADSTPPS